jgi:hypothetical protein
MAGFREFQTGEVLTAANVNDFLMEQAVMTFADATARTAALSGVLREGILTYNEDTAQLEVYDGSAFVVAAPAPPAGIGSNVVQTVKTDTFSTNSGTFTNVTGLSVTITPSTASSKILLIGSFAAAASSTTVTGYIQVSGGNAGTFVGDAAGNRVRTAIMFHGGSDRDASAQSFTYLDSPSTTSAVTYNVQMRIGASGGTVRLNRGENDVDNADGGRPASAIIAIEVAP